MFKMCHFITLFHSNRSSLDSLDGYRYLSSHGVVVSGSGKGAAQLADLSSGFVNGNNIPGRGKEVQTKSVSQDT